MRRGLLCALAIGTLGACTASEPVFERRAASGGLTFKRTEYWTSAQHTTRASVCTGPSRCTGERTICHGPPTRFVTSSWESCGNE